MVYFFLLFQLFLQWFYLLKVVLLAAAEILNSVLYLLGVYSSEGMVLANSVLLATVSIVCVCEITIFSYRFRTVLKTLGAINQVSTESQVRRIVWITVTGNMFFFTRAFLESIFAVLLFVYWRRNGSVAEVFSHGLWDVYIALKHWSEVAILGLMLYILQSRFATSSNAGDDSRGSYREVPDAEDNGQKVPSSMEVWIEHKWDSSNWSYRVSMSFKTDMIPLSANHLCCVKQSAVNKFLYLIEVVVPGVQ